MAASARNRFSRQSLTLSSLENERPRLFYWRACCKQWITIGVLLPASHSCVEKARRILINKKTKCWVALALGSHALLQLGGLCMCELESVFVVGVTRDKIQHAAREHEERGEHDEERGEQVK